MTNKNTTYYNYGPQQLKIVDMKKKIELLCMN